MIRNATSALPPAQILVVDDEPDLLTLYELTLLREGYSVSTAGTLAQARESLARQNFDVLITDMRLPDGQGLALLRELTEAHRPERSIVITAYGSPENAVESLKQGAFDYLTKPVDLKQFRAVVRSAVQAAPGTGSKGVVAAAQPDAQPAAPVAATSPSDANPSGAERALARLVGESPAMQAVKARIARVARSMAPVLVRGESGTGKELVARALHDCSHRASGPFVPVNCGAIPEHLLEAEFFGARKGAYTGAMQDREGLFQTARGGTLFLDEIGDLPLAMQAKLLRAIQERRIRPLGEPQEQAVDVRLVSATHKDLAAEVQAGRFRQDLYYRLNVIEIVVPPLRERRADLPLLARTLLARIAGEAGLPAPKPSQRLLARLQEAPLPGNVRELENILYRAVALGGTGEADALTELGLGTPVSNTPLSFHNPDELAESELDTSGSLPTANTQSNPDFEPTQPVSLLPEPDAADAPIGPVSLPHDLQAWIDQQERRVLIEALEQTRFNRTAAAARLGLNLRQIRYRMARLGITAPGSGANEHSPDSGDGDGDTP
jgi:two-component system response regulator PilR (NtrC family)